MKPGTVERDERTLVVENAGYRWSYVVLSFGLLILVAYRSFFRHEESWDLLALVILGGLINTTYQGSRQVLYRGRLVLGVVAMVLAAVLGLVAVLLRRAA